jgi:hypothetical protein
MAYEIDYSGWPLVRVRTDPDLSSDGAQIAVSAFEALLARRTPFAVAYDAGEPDADSANGSEQNGHLAVPIVWDWIARRRSDLDAYCVAWASYLPDERRRAAAEQHYARGVDQAAGTPSMPIRTFATWPETEAWAGQQLWSRQRPM